MTGQGVTIAISVLLAVAIAAAAALLMRLLRHPARNLVDKLAAPACLLTAANGRFLKANLAFSSALHYNLLDLLQGSLRLHDLLDPSDASPVQAALDGLRAGTCQQARLDVTLHCKDGTPYPCTLAAVRLTGRGLPPASLLVTLQPRANGARPAGERVPRSELERARQLSETSRQISGLPEGGELLRQVSSSAMALTDARCAAVALFSPDGERLLDPFLLDAPTTLTQLLAPRDLLLAQFVAAGPGSLLVTDLDSNAHSAFGAMLLRPTSQRRWLELLKGWQAAGVNSFVIAPLVAAGSSLGVLAAFNLLNDPPLGERDRYALVILAQQAACALLNHRLQGEYSQRRKEMDALGETLNRVVGENDLNRLLNRLTRQAVDLLHASGAELALVNDSRGLEVQVSYQMPLDNTGRRITSPDEPAGYVARSRRPLIIDPHNRWTGATGALNPTDGHAALIVPLQAGKRLVGVLSVLDSRAERIFSPDDVRLLHLFCQQAAVAIDNARLVRQARREAEEAETLRQASSAVTATLQPDEIIRRILEQLARVVPYDSAAVHLVSEEMVVLRAGHGFEPGEKVEGLQLRLDDNNPATRVIREGQPVIYADVQRHFKTFLQPPHNRIHGWMGVPMIVHNQVTGLISLDAHEPGRFNNHHAELVSAFADQVAIALENADLYQRAVRAADSLTTLYTAGQQISGSLNPDDVLRAVRNAVGQLMQYDAMLIGWFTPDHQSFAPLFLATPGAVETRASHPLLGNPFADSFLSGEIVRAGRLSLDLSEALPLPEGICTPAQSMMMVPLKPGGKLAGVLAVMSCQPNGFAEDQQRMLELLASQAAIALDNASLFHQTEELAITDPLTGLFNRRRFYDVGNVEFERTNRYFRPLSMLMIDLDHFKDFNDRYGHFTGDDVLIGLSQIFEATVRQVDVVARYGGEEFVVMLPETGARQAVEMAQRLRQLVQDTPILTRQGPLHVTVSIGVGVRTAACDDLETLIDWADRGLYEAKNNGRNRVEIHYLDPLPQSGRKI